MSLLDEKKEQNSYLAISIIGGLFFVFGFVTWLNGSLIPFLQIACELTNLEAYLVTMAFYIAYTVMALPVSSVLSRVGYRNGMALGLFVMAVGALIFIPAAQARAFEIFLLGLFVLASGLTLLQTAANPYIVLLGPRETAAVRISLMGLLNKGAGVIAPIVFTAFVLSDMAQFEAANLATLTQAAKELQLEELSTRLILPYVVLAAALFVLAVIIKFSPLPEPQLENDQHSDVKKRDILKYPQLVFGVFTLFLYVGVEVIAGDTIGLFGKELGVENFGQLTSYTMAFMVAAYVMGMVVIPKYISQEKALAISAALGVALSVLILTTTGNDASVWNTLFFWTGASAIPNVVLYVALLGFANALVWPVIWPMALEGLGKHTSTGSALLIMGISGGALLPLLYGWIADLTGDAQIAYITLIPCYLVILWYALSGHKIRSWSANEEIQFQAE